MSLTSQSDPDRDSFEPCGVPDHDATEEGEQVNEQTGGTAGNTVPTIALPSIEDIEKAIKAHPTEIDEVVIRLSGALGKCEGEEARIDTPSYEYLGALSALAQSIEIDASQFRDWAREVRCYLRELTHLHWEGPIDAA